MLALGSLLGCMAVGEAGSVARGRAVSMRWREVWPKLAKIGAGGVLSDTHM